jgi:hypothetical protein
VSPILRINAAAHRAYNFYATIAKRMDVRPVTLEGRHVRLEPLAMEHHPGLCAVGLDDELWRWIPAPVRTPEDHMAECAG